jgi:hypothetical protein
VQVINCNSILEKKNSKKACSCHGKDGNKKKIRTLLQFKQITNWVPEKIMPTSSKICEGGSKPASQPASHKSWSLYSPWYKLTEEKRGQ